jgi:O-acetyl-ADP-ribose deacetylase (regulator of RNase III)
MVAIQYVRGDATCPQAKGVKLIPHIVNDIGKWGKGFVMALTARWDRPERDYRTWYSAGKEAGFHLGAVQFVQVEPYLWIANMVAQHGVKRGSSGPPIRYDALTHCLLKVTLKAAELGASVHMPRIGCGLAGGQWSKVEAIILQSLGAANIPVTVYDFD